MSACVSNRHCQKVSKEVKLQDTDGVERTQTLIDLQVTCRDLVNFLVQHTAPSAALIIMLH
jgi:hypothetical protein